jgi:PAS domain S-box-containing protein
VHEPEGSWVTGSTDTHAPLCADARRETTAAAPSERAGELDSAELKRLLDASPAGIFRTDVDGRTIYAAGALLRRIGLAGPGPWGDRWFDFLHGEDRERLRAEWEAAVAGHASLHTEYRLKPFDGLERWVLTDAKPQFDATGRFIGHVGTTTDITEQKRTEARLRDGEELYRSVVAGLGDGLLLVSGDGTILECNARAAGILGTPMDELKGRNATGPQHLLFDEYGTRLMPGQYPVNVTLRTGVSCADQILLLERPDKTRVWISANHQPLIRPGERQPYGVVITLSDITDRRNTEAALRRAKDQAEAASRTKSAFLANMSHELRTPLNAIIGFSEIMRDELLGPLGAPHYREYAADIFQSGKHLLDLINDILDLSKVEAGRLELHDEDCNVPEILASSLRLMNERAHANEIRIEQRFPVRLPLLRADARSLKQILLNLVSNAIKFTPAEGRILISAEADEDSFRLVVKDTGIGMTSDGVKKALEAFGQVDSSLSRKYEGTGLGLPLTRALIELHGGRLEIESALGEGTCVTAIFPGERIIRELPPV